MVLKWLKNKTVWFLAFLLPILVIGSVLIQKGIYPFGEKTILTVDLRGQYVGMLAYLRDIYLGKGSLFYSFSKGLGGNMSGLFAYYLASPLNLILLLFSKSHITEAILLISLIKIGLCGLTAAVYLNKHFRKYSGSIVVFSSCYALMSYTICYLSNIMWLDGVIWLPIILLGIERLIKKQKIELYLISLTLSIFSNYYIGYMLCLTSVIYFIYYLFLQGLKSQQLKNALYQFTLSSLASGGLTAFLLIPTLLSLRNGKMSFKLTEAPLKLDISPLDLLSKLFIGGFNGKQLEKGFPCLFISSLCISLVIGYFLNKHIQLKEKLATTAVLLIFYISFSVSSLNLVWHGFDYPVCFLYRNAFIVCFLLIILAYKSYENLSGLKVSHYIGIMGIWCLIGILVFLKHYSFLSGKKVGLTILLAFLGCICLYLYSIQTKRLFLILAGLIIYGELGLNAWAIEGQFSYFPRKYIVEGIKSFTPVIEELSAQKDFFRLEEFYQIVDTEPMLLGYKGIDHSSSAIEKKSVDFLKKLGVCSYKATVNQKYIEACTLPTDMLFGIKYYLMWHHYQPIDSLKYTWSAQPFYSHANKEDDMILYENPYALPIGYSVSQKVLDPLPDTHQVFEVQNCLLNQLNNTTKSYYTPVTIQKVSFKNIQQIQTEEETIYMKQDKSLPASITYELSSPHYAPLYMNLTSMHYVTDKILKNSVEVSVNGQNATYYFLGSQYGIQNLGAYVEGKTIQVTLKLLDQQLAIKDSLFYTLDMVTFEALHKTLLSQSMTVTDWHEGYVEGNIAIKNQNQILMTSILYDSGWQIKVDGIKQKPIAIQHALLGIPLEKGPHHIIMYYEVPGLKLGITLSLLTLLLLMGGHLAALLRRMYQ